MTTEPSLYNRIVIRARAAMADLWRSEGSLSRKALRSGVWMMGSAASTHCLRFVQTVVLVRLLVPDDFGLMRIAGFVVAAMATFSQMGLGAAVIQRKDISRDILNTAWTLTLIRNVILYAAIFALAPWVAEFYRNPLISPILRVVSLRLLLSALGNSMGLVLLRKELDFRKHELFEIICNAGGIAMTIAAAWWLRSVWALAIGQLAFAFLRLAGSYIVHPFRPRPSINWAAARSLISFGKHILSAGVVVFLKTQLDDAILGRMKGTEALGFYTLAYALSNMPATFITHTISGVTFSAYSKIQDQRKRLGQAFLKTLRVNAALSIPAAAGLAVLAPEIVNVVYTPKYAAMIPCFIVLCIFGLLRSIGAQTGPVFTAIGKPYVVTWLVAGNLTIMLALIYPLTRAYGITGTAWATVIPSVGDTILALYLVCLFSGLSKLRIARALVEIALVTAFMAAAVYSYKTLYNEKTLGHLLAYILLGFGTYTLGMLIFCKKTSGVILRTADLVTGKNSKRSAQ